MIQAWGEENIEAAQLLLRDRFKPAEHSLQNVDAAMALDQTSVVRYRGRGYRVPPVPYDQGLQLQRLHLELLALTKDEAPETAEQLEQVLVILQDLLPLFKQLCRPTALFERLTWRWRRPFDDASQSELGELLGFFSACRTKSTVEFPHAMGRRSASLSTRSTILRPSFGTSRSGAMKLGSPGRGRTA